MYSIFNSFVELLLMELGICEALNDKYEKTMPNAVLIFYFPLYKGKGKAGGL